MLKRLLLASATLALGWAASSAEPKWVPITSSKPSPPSVRILENSGNRIVVKMELAGYFTEVVSAAGLPCTLVTLPECPSSKVLGDPDIPCVRTNLAIPGTARMVLGQVLTSMREVRVENYLPSKGPIYRNENPSSFPYIFGAAYQSAGDYPAQPALLGDPFILRNVRGLPLQFNPVILNPTGAKLKICESITVEIVSEGEDHRNALSQGRKVRESREFLEVYESRFLNPPKAPEYTPVGEAGRLLIITYDSFYDAVLPFYHWKLQKGTPTSIVTATQAGGTAANIKNYILNQYQSPQGLTYVLLVGDYQQVPFMPGTAGNVAGNPSDPSYALLAGDDNYFEVFISRLSAQTIAAVQVQVNKVINYEKAPQPSGAWYHKAFGIAGDDEGGSPSYTDWERVEFLRGVLQVPAYLYTDFDQIYHGSATASQVSTAVNSGRGIGLYIGHGSETSWATSGFGVSDVNALTNSTGMLPFILSVACVNGKFNYSSDCFAEAWLKAGTPSAPKGAVAFYGSSTNQSWVPPCVGQREAVDLLASETYHTIGALCMNGCMKAVDDYPGTGGESGAELCQSWHLFGDASMLVYSDTPSSMGVTHLGVLIVGTSSYDVSAPGVAGALCALYDEAGHTLYGSAFTDASGNATIEMATPPTGPLTLKLTVTAFNRVPYFGDVAVIVPSGPYLIYRSHAVSDAGGNGDGIANPGEAIVLPVTVENIGAGAAAGLAATLSSADPHVTVTDGSAAFADLPEHAAGQSLPDHFGITVSPGCPDGHPIPFDIGWTATGGHSGTARFNLPVCSPLAISNVQATGITDGSATITWTTNIPADSRVTYGSSVPPGTVKDDAALVTGHSVTLTGLGACTPYRFSVTSRSLGCYSATDNGGGTYHGFTTAGRSFAMGPDGVEGGALSWVVSPATGANIWHQDTCKAVSGTRSWKAGKSDSPACVAQYDPGLANHFLTWNADIALGPAGHGYHLRFNEWYDSESNAGCTYDPLRTQISTDGGAGWTTLATSCGASGGWVARDFDLAPFTGATVRVRFYFSSNAGTSGLGWFLDDIGISKSQGCSADVVYRGHAAADACSGAGTGGGNGIWDRGEDAAITITAVNGGMSAASNVAGTLTTSTPGVTVTDGTATFPSMAANGGTGASQPDHFSVHADPSIACGTVADFTLHTTSTENPSGSDSAFTMTVGQPGGTMTAFGEDFTGAAAPALPAGWTTLVTTGNAWATNVGGCAGNALMYPYNSWAAADSWAFSPPVALAAGVTYTMAFNQKVYSASYPEAMEVKCGLGTTAAAQAVPIYSATGLANTACASRAATFTVPAAGTYYFGFHGTSAANMRNLYLDDIAVTYTQASSCGTCAAAPPEVGPGTTPATSQGWTDKATATWPSEAAATSYTLYRGTKAELPGLCSSTADSCTKYAGAATGTATITEDPTGIAGGFYWYLVTGANGSGEGTAGVGQCNPRVVNSTGACP